MNLKEVIWRGVKGTEHVMGSILRRILPERLYNPLRYRYWKLRALIIFLLRTIACKNEHRRWKRTQQKHLKQKTAEIMHILKGGKFRRVMVFHSPVPWETICLHRFHYIALHLSQSPLSNSTTMVIFMDPEIPRAIRIDENLWVVPQKMGWGLCLKPQFWNAPAMPSQLTKYMLLSWECLPESPEILQVLKNSGFYIIYDVSGFGLPHSCIPRFHENTHKKLLEHRMADLILCDSAITCEMIRKTHSIDHTFLLENSPDDRILHISRNQTHIIPEELSSVIQAQKPIAGYTGIIHSWLDMDLLEFTAQQCPDWEFILLGPVHDMTSVEKLSDEIPNLHYLGPIPHDRLLHYTIWMDAGVFPVKPGRIENPPTGIFPGLPVEICAFLAMDKPVICSGVPREWNQWNLIQIATGQEDFVQKLRQAYSRTTPAPANHTIGNTPQTQDFSWTAQVQQFVAFLDHLEQPHR